LKTILNIALLNKYGYKISHIDKMGPEEIREKILSLSQIQAQQERIINDLIQCMVDLDLEKFEFILDHYIMARGIEKAIIHIIFPFLERIGILWLTNHINPAQEHLVTNLIRQKLIVGIESTVSHVQVNKSVLLFLPENEHHELGILFMYYLLKSRGIKVLYIGSNAPLNDVEYVVKLKKPDIVYTHLTATSLSFNFERFLTQLSSRLPETTIFVSGQVTAQYKKPVPPNVQFKKTLSEVMEYIATL
jgi:methanogenic corrinoid protein MtbC1